MSRIVQIPFAPRAQQRDMLALMDLYTFFVAVCHRRMGKTVLGVNWLVKEAFTSIQDYRGYYIAPNQKQAKNLVWSYFKTYLAPLGKHLVNFNETELRIDLPHNCKIHLAGAENIESLRGVYIDRAVLDEMASWINAQYGFYEVLYPAMSDRRGHALIIGTVKGLDLFHEFFQRGQDNTFPDWGSVLYDVYSTGVFSTEQIIEIKRLMTPAAFGREYECNFFASNPEVLITPEDYFSAVNRPVDPSSVRSYPRVGGFDVGFTTDPSVYVERQGPVMHAPVSLKNKDSAYQANWLARKIKENRLQHLFIDAGTAEGVTTRLERLGYSNIVVPVWFNGTSPAPSCYNLRAFMYLSWKNWMNRGGSVPKHDQLMKEATNQLVDDSDADRKVKLQRKDKIKARIGCSPDHADAAAPTFAGDDEEMLDPLEDERRSTPSEANRLAISRMTQQEPVKDYDVLDFLNKSGSEYDQFFGMR